ncbi:hypothetical protein CK226_25645 [Mesorhizobium sp. WSM4311]|nr:hypothetical protein CK226_25645 [Mesorhizobium sp. WSM4311]TRC95942.1 hypothetical protein FJV82_27240 [Mesorhizobium sp. WSM4305]
MSFPKNLRISSTSRSGVSELSPTLFRPLMEDGQLVAPLPTVLKGPDWYFALIREGDQRPAPRSFSNWLRAKIQRSHWQD